jgi:hypothetical protein
VVTPFEHSSAVRAFVSAQNLAVVQTRMKHGYVERMLYPDRYDSIQCATAKELCFAALKLFSPCLPKAHERRSLLAIGGLRPEAQYERFFQLPLILAGRRAFTSSTTIFPAARSRCDAFEL